MNDNPWEGGGYNNSKLRLNLPSKKKKTRKSKVKVGSKKKSNHGFIKKGEEKMKYPKEVAEQVGVLETYTEDAKLSAFDIFHLYPKEIAYPNGFYDSRFFECIGFNTKTRKKRNLGSHDSLDFLDGCFVNMIRIFADGSTMVRVNKTVEIMNSQGITVYPPKYFENHFPPIR